MSAMFLQESSTPVTEQAVFEALGNPHDRQILAHAQADEVEAQGLIERTGIPKSTIYRRIDRLCEIGLLEATGGRLRNGHVVDRYRARIDDLALVVQDGEIHARWATRDEDAYGLTIGLRIADRQASSPRRDGPIASQLSA